MREYSADDPDDSLKQHAVRCSVFYIAMRVSIDAEARVGQDEGRPARVVERDVHGGVVACVNDQRRPLCPDLER